MKKWFISLFIISLIFGCKEKEQHLVKIKGELLPITAELEDVKEVEDIILPYRNKVFSEMKSIISYTPINLTKNDGDFESTLGNLMADMCYDRANPVFESRTGKTIDFSMFNNGGLRNSISKGSITTEHAFGLMPFENMLVVVEVPASRLKDLVNYLKRGKSAHPLSKQIKLTINKDNYELKVHNKPVDMNRNYFILTSDFLQRGGDNMNFFSNPLKLHKLDYKVRNAIIDYLKENDTVHPVLDGRLKIEL